MHRRTLALAGPALLLARPAFAQAWPNRPIRLIVPWSTATTSDLLGRLVAMQLSERMGHSFVVENQAGAGGSIGAAAAMRATADGHTLLLMTTATSIAPRLFRSVTFRPVQDFSLVGTIGFSPNVLVTGPRVPIGSMAELIAEAKKAPNRLRYASSGPGSGSWISMELLKSMAEIQLEEIPYSSTAQATTDTISGQIELHCPSLAGAIATLRAGHFRPLGVTGARRSASAPEIPAIAETVPGYDSAGWFALAAPAGTPEAILDRLNAELQAMLAEPTVKAALVNAGVDADPGSRAASLETMQSGMRRLTDLMDRIGHQPR
jgi:tripartite-type tricarboxylate transporter receptor subunit TctC